MTGRFVVLEHRWDGIHWDLMLETRPGGPLRTWAVDEAIVAGRELPARALSDHRAAYLDYEGEVSGDRGTVRRIDGGEFEALVWTDDIVSVRLSGAQLGGVAVLRRAVAGGGPERVGGDSAPWVFRLGNRD